MESFKSYLAKVATGASLTRDEARAAFDDLLSGEVTNAQGGAFLMALRVRGEALEEIVGAVSGRFARDVEARQVMIHGAPGVEVTVRAVVPALGIGGPAVALEVSGHAVEEPAVEEPP